jgi:hypothetical protein
MSVRAKNANSFLGNEGRFEYEYERKIREEEQWRAKQIECETSGYKVNWLFHPVIAERYVRRMVSGSHWTDYVKHYFGGPAGAGLGLRYWRDHKATPSTESRAGNDRIRCQ